MQIWQNLHVISPELAFLLWLKMIWKDKSRRYYDQCGQVDNDQFSNNNSKMKIEQEIFYGENSDEEDEAINHVDVAISKVF